MTAKGSYRTCTIFDVPPDPDSGIPVGLPDRGADAQVGATGGRLQREPGQRLLPPGARAAQAGPDKGKLCW